MHCRFQNYTARNDIWLAYLKLFIHIGFSFVRVAVACAILKRTSGFEPSFEAIAPRYVKLVTVQSVCPLTLTSL